MRVIFNEGIKAIVSLLSNSALAAIIVFVAATLYSASHSLPSVHSTLLIWSDHLISGATVALFYSALLTWAKMNVNSLEQDVHFKTAQKVPSMPRTSEAVYHGAIHEAGHAMTLTMLPDDLLPDTLSLSIEKEFPPSQRSMGRMHYQFDAIEAPYRSEFQTWLLHCYRAGRIAETIIFNQASVGATDDLQQWEYIARKHCLTHGLPYFAMAQSEYEANRNLNTLNELANKIDDSLVNLLTQNTDLLIEMAKQLQLQGTLNREELLAFRQRIQPVFSAIQ